MYRYITAAAVAAAVFAAAPSDSAAQVATADAQAFIGEWHLPLDAMGQAVNLQIDIEDADGLLEVEIAREGSETEVEDVTLREGTLILEYEVDMQGQMAPIELSLTPDGEGMKANLDIAGGMLELDGVATKH